MASFNAQFQVKRQVTICLRAPFSKNLLIWPIRLS